MTHFAIARLIAAGALLLAVGPMPYPYYRLMRWLVCAIAGFGGVRAYERKAVGWVWALGAVAIVFNPIVPLGFGRSDWAVIDVIGAVMLLASFSSRSLNHSRP